MAASDPLPAISVRQAAIKIVQVKKRVSDAGGNRSIMTTRSSDPHPRAARLFGITVSAMVAAGLVGAVYALSATDCSEVGPCNVARDIGHAVPAIALVALGFGAVGYGLIHLLQLAGFAPSTLSLSVFAVVFLSAVFMPFFGVPAFRLTIMVINAIE